MAGHALPHVTDSERRARLVARHRLAQTAEDAVDVARSVVALHSTDPATPYLAARARVRDFEREDLETALWIDRSLCRLHAMRRTLFVVAIEDLAVVEAAASRGVARRERKRFEQWLAAEDSGIDAGALLARVEERVMEALSDGGERRTQELTAAVPELATPITLGTGKWSTRTTLASRLLLVMAMDGLVVRTRPSGSWRSGQYHWASAEAWFGGAPEPLEPAVARVELARRYIATHGPATVEDLRWWTGWSARDAEAALVGLGARMVRLDDGSEGLVLEPDLDFEGGAVDQVALLPALDPTPMGWKSRDWYLGPHANRLFDRNGNIGPSVWVGGRIVGGWAQRPDGEVVHCLLEDVGADAARRVAAQAEDLTEWLGGTVVIPRFRTPLEKDLVSGDR